MLDKVTGIIGKHFYNTQLAWVHWPGAIAKHRERIVNAGSDEQFEVAMLALLAELQRSHVGFFHESLSRSSSKMALCATYLVSKPLREERWTFQDVHAGGPAALAGIRPGDVLLAVDGRPFRPPEHPLFAVKSNAKITVLAKGLREEIKDVVIPAPKRIRGQLPQVVPTSLVSYKRLPGDIGYVRIAMYPGQIGVEIANEISLAIQNVGQASRLILDLRGNTGGGIGVLRAMSLLTPSRLQVGRYAGGGMTPVNGAKGYHFVFDRIPSQKLGLIPLALKAQAMMSLRKAVGLNTPILIATEGLDAMPFHGRIVILVNRHTASANEMLVAFAREHQLATIVGEATPGRVLGGNKFALFSGYWLVLPVGSYQTAEGDGIEGLPIEPDVLVPFEPEQARAGLDTQLDRAIEVVSAM
ncbi:C-terminal processing protease CtpA/Prc [Silvibacterium bohemicum]|uniref:C-terminal processing protease CtpA/Prc n=1 Tax=Silvibacterium bohemicum TaxID=1577686 RepID=A0A841K168_9BACT|nr:C-terminal processing protease CtpA/Prc [Silvibacterium bohemicum]